MEAHSRRSVLAAVAAGSGATLLTASGCAPRSGAPLARSGEPALLDLLEASRAVRARTLSPVELTEACLERIMRLDARLDAFITVTAERALAAARRAEAEVMEGRWRGPLHGIPIAIKDNFDTSGVRTTAGSALFAGRVPDADAEVVERLANAGAISLGKLNLHEFGMGATSTVSHFGAVHNPWDLERMSGGSSGGSAAAVAAGLCFGAVGTDTGGSIRIPAACCGIVGLKPTHGVVSTRGVIPLSWSFDCVGPMCRTVGDTLAMFGALTNHPVAHPSGAAAGAAFLASLRLGVLPGRAPYCDTVAEPEVQAAFDAALDVLRSLVAEVRDAELPMPDLGRLLEAEAHAYHAEHLARAPELYDPRTRAALLAGQGIPAAEPERLRRELERHRATIDASFAAVDVVVTPTLMELPPTLAEARDPFAISACTFVFNLGGLPALSVPCGFSRSGLPIALTLGGPALSEPALFALALAYEQATGWHRRHPPL